MAEKKSRKPRSRKEAVVSEAAPEPAVAPAPPDAALEEGPAPAEPAPSPGEHDEDHGDETESGKAPEASTEVEFEHTMTRAEAVEYLRAIVAGLESGRVRFELGDDVLELAIPGAVSVEVEAERRPDREKIEIEIEWRPRVPDLRIT